jgi:hypothetical protein
MKVKIRDNKHGVILKISLIQSDAHKVWGTKTKVKNTMKIQGY